jgi:4-hydroxy-2-oxoheptanedioate aldolase
MNATRVGTVLSLAGAAIAELVARHFDFVWIDLEHGALGQGDMQDAIIGIQASGADALVRAPLAMAYAPMLDAGADGIVVPRVECVAEAEAAVARLRLPPAGIRGYGPRRLAVRPSLAPPDCVLQIETLRGVEEARAIAAVDGVDALVVGCADLSHELGEPLLFETPAMCSALAAVGEAARAAGVTFGVAGVPRASSPPDTGLVVVGCDVRIFDAALADAAAGALRHVEEAPCPST